MDIGAAPPVVWAFLGRIRFCRTFVQLLICWLGCKTGAWDLGDASIARHSVHRAHYLRISAHLQGVFAARLLLFASCELSINMINLSVSQEQNRCYARLGVSRVEPKRHPLPYLRP